MFENIQIKNFRGIKNLEIDKLARINLFVGDNNCGKSSLLEALFLLTAPTNTALDLSINFIREYMRVNKNDIQLLFYGYKFNGNNTINISANMKNFKTNLEIIHYEKAVENNVLLDKDNVSNQKQIEYGLKNIFSLSDKNKTTQYENTIKFTENIISLVENQQSTPISKSFHQNENDIDNTVFAKFIPPKYKFESSISKLREIKEQKKDHEIISVINKIEPKIVGIDYIGNDVFVDIGIEKLVPINMMGDGIRKLLSIILSMHDCKDGIIFIDEIDNGFHYSKMPLLWKTVIESANQLNVQVFATTHNYDSLKGLAKILSDDTMISTRNDALTFYLQHLQDDTIKPYAYGYENFEFLINQGEEIR